MADNTRISKAMTIKLEDLFDDLPEMPQFADGIRRAPTRHFALNPKDTELALKMPCATFRRNGINSWHLNSWRNC